MKAWAAAGLFLFAAALPCAARDVEVRGTLLCRDEGDVLRERPADRPCLLVRADEYPRVVEIVEAGALFRLRLPSSAIDRALVLRVYRGEKLVDAFRVHVDAGRIVRDGDVGVVSVGAHVLSLDCAQLDCPLDIGLAARERLLASAQVSSSHRTRKLSYFLSPVLLLVPALAKGGAADVNAGVSPKGAKLALSYDLLEPAAFPAFAHTAGSPAIGRSLTSRRHPEETAIWNPSALAQDLRSGVSFGAGSMNSMRGSVWLSTPESWRDDAPWAPTVASAAFLRYAANGVNVRVDPQAPVDFEESLFVSGLGFAIGDHAGLSASVRYHRSMDEVPRADGKGVRQGVVDFDLGATWDPSPWLRVAVAGASLRGEKADERFVGAHEAPREGIVGVALMKNAIQGGLEFGVREGGSDLSAGMNVRAFDGLMIDLGGSSVENALQIGVETTFGPAKLGFRTRTDDLDGFQHLIWTSISGILGS